MSSISTDKESSSLQFFKQTIQQAVELVPKMAPKEKLRAVQFWNQISEHLQVIVNNSASEINALASYLHEQETPSNPMNSSTSIVSKSPNHTNSTNNASSMTLEEQMPMLSDKNSIDFDIELAKQMTSESNTNHTGTNTETGNSTDPMNNAASELDSELNDFDLSAPTSMSIGNFIADESCLDEMQLIASPILTDQNQAQSDSHLSIFAYDQRPSLPSSVAVEDALNTSTSTHHLIDTASHPNFGISATGGQKCEASMMTVENRDKSTILVSNNDCDNPSTTHVVHERRFQCELCGARFTAKHSLLVHVRRHTGERPFACDHCGRTFAQSSVLKAHLDTHLGDRKYECGVCGKKFSQRPQLRLHLQRHNGERRWACSSCDARFVTRADLTRHALSHSGQKPFACTLCEKRFTRKQALEEHSNRHFGIRPYSCALCDKQFVEQSAYNKHLKGHKTNDSGKIGSISQTSQPSSLCFYNSSSEFLSNNKSAAASSNDRNANESHDQMFLDLEQLERSLDQTISVEPSDNADQHKTVENTTINFEHLSSVTNNSSVF